VNQSTRGSFDRTHEDRDPRLPSDPEPRTTALKPRESPAQPGTSEPPRRQTAATKPEAARAKTHGLHGHPFDANVARVAAVELVGTFLLVVTIVGAVVAAALSDPVAGAPYGSLAVPLAGGVGLAIGISALGHLSGAHFNPAVTIGLAVNGRFPWRWVPAYLLAQFGGSTTAAAAVWCIYGGRARSIARLGTPSPASHVALGQTLAAEAVGTFVLVLVVVAVATDERAARTVAALSIGSALAAAILLTGPISGAGLNPARSFGPMLTADTFATWWPYLVAPLIGSCVAVALYDRVLRVSSRP
jgi:MIP family channel proteins